MVRSLDLDVYVTHFDYINPQSSPYTYSFSVLFYFPVVSTLKQNLWLTTRSRPLCKATNRISSIGNAIADLPPQKILPISQSIFLQKVRGKAELLGSFEVPWCIYAETSRAALLWGLILAESATNLLPEQYLLVKAVL